jgi:hypothetical protein
MIFCIQDCTHRALHDDIAEHRGTYGYKRYDLLPSSQMQLPSAAAEGRGYARKGKGGRAFAIDMGGHHAGPKTERVDRTVERSGRAVPTGSCTLPETAPGRARETEDSQSTCLEGHTLLPIRGQFELYVPTSLLFFIMRNRVDHIGGAAREANTYGPLEKVRKELRNTHQSPGFHLGAIPTLQLLHVAQRAVPGYRTSGPSCLRRLLSVRTHREEMNEPGPALTNDR